MVRMWQSSMFCEHANEVPGSCSCEEDCYCKLNTCKTKIQVIEKIVLKPIEIIVHVRTRSEMNQSRQEHWSTKKKIVDAQHDAVTYALRAESVRCLFKPPIRVTLARMGPKRLDSDNYRSALKATRDAIAKWIGIDDGRDDLLEWVYDPQEENLKYGVRIRIESKPNNCPTCKRDF